MKKLLIVESPAKAKTIGKYLGGEFVVKSSIGHIRDLPREDKAIQIVEKGRNHWEFVPTYEISDEKKKVVGELKSAVKASDEIYLASDPDREGEAIAWHLREVLSPVAQGKPFHRVTYNEITKSAVLKAVAEPRDIDMPRVDAQQARRILDRLVGYKVSRLLWRNIDCPNSKTLSAGRVQSVALRLLVERQREIDAFKPETYYLMGVEAQAPSESATFVAKLSRLDGEKPDIRNRETADGLLQDLTDAALKVTDLKEQPKVRHALPPFTTSTLQQAASSVLGYAPGKTMKLAQSLYEHGRITYMRSDSVNVSVEARAQAKDFIVSRYGAKFYPAKPNVYATKAKSGVQAQEAHEAIRPTDIGLLPESSGLEAMEQKLYDLIWRRFVASQMAEAHTTVKTLCLEACKPDLAHRCLFTASATIIDFEGFLKVMKLSLKKKREDGEESEDTDEVAYLPDVQVGDSLKAVRWLADEKQTKGPAHYSEASLIKALEENGVGRPSTYAATIETLKARLYAKTEKRKLIPLERGLLVCDWLVKKLDELFNVGYTAQMEAQLDEVEEKGVPMNEMLSAFYVKLMGALAGTEDPPPAAEKFTLVFNLLSKVTNWKPATKVGKRIYDDQAFIQSVKDQAAMGKRLSTRQLSSLVRMVFQYADQIPGAEDALREAGLAAKPAAVSQSGDQELVKFCFDTIDRVENPPRSGFYKSLRGQYDRGRSLSAKQLKFLAQMVLENIAALADQEEIKAKLAAGVPDLAVGQKPANPVVEELLKMTEEIKDWRAPVVRGKLTIDDEAFCRSLRQQFATRRTLTARQTSALKRVVTSYVKSIPNGESRLAALKPAEE